MSEESIEQCLDIDGKLVKKAVHSPSNEILIKGLKTMLLTRYIDERMINLQRQGQISFAMNSLGEEGCIVASAAALETADWIYPQYREQGAAFWRGFTPQEFCHHMYCNQEDCNKGHQMPNHFGSRKLNIVTISSPLGTQIPHAAGAAYAMKLRNEPTVALCYFGEGTTSEGDFHVGVNFAAVRKSPVIFFCRNNQYAISTHSRDQYACKSIATRAAGYGIKGVQVDGNDFFAVYNSVMEAKAHCLAGHGPVLIEAITYRMGAHSTSDDPSAYRSTDEVEKWADRCPIKRLRSYLVAQAKWHETTETDYVQAMHVEVEQAINKAKATGRPALQTLIEDVYFAVPENLAQQLNEIKLHLPGGI